MTPKPKVSLTITKAEFVYTVDGEDVGKGRVVEFHYAGNDLKTAIREFGITLQEEARQRLARRLETSLRDKARKRGGAR